MAQDARRVVILAVFFGVSLVGCASPGKHVPPTKPLTPYSPSATKKTDTPPAATAKPDVVNMSQAKPATVTGGSAMAPPPPVTLPGAAAPSFGVPTIATTTPVIANASPEVIKAPSMSPLASTESILPPTPPRMPIAPGAPAEPSLAPIVPPISGVVEGPK